MASNFRVSMQRNNKNLHINLCGDFDGNSAWEIFYLLKKNAKAFHRIIIHTDGLNIIIPFGVDVFHQTLRGLRNEPVQVLFAGKKADQLSPEKGSYHHAKQREPEMSLLQGRF